MTWHSQSPIGELYEHPYRFDFFQAVRLLEQYHPERVPVGNDGPPTLEVIRFRSNPSLDFPASTIQSLIPGRLEEERALPDELVVNFFGLTGPNSILPSFYTQLLLNRERRSAGPEAGALRAWMDLFSHRLLSLFYHAWRKYRLTAELSSYSGKQHDPITASMISMIGLATPGLEDRFAGQPDAPVSDPGGFEDVALLRYAGLLTAKFRPAGGLQRMLSDFFDTPIKVEQFVGRWLHLHEENWTRLGNPLGQNNSLGDNVLVGRKVWDLSGKIRVRIGPLNLEQFSQWLPDRRRIFVLAKLVKFYTRDELSFEVQLVLAGEDVPKLQLNKPGRGATARLGWNSWLAGRAMERAVSDTTFQRQELDTLAEHP